MAGIIITGHGQFATGFYYSLKMLAGEQEWLKAVDFREDHSEEILSKNLLEAYEAIEDKNAVFVLCDILGGSPFKNAAAAFMGKDNVKIIYGANLGMALELCLKCMLLDGEMDKEAIDALADEMVETGKSNMGKFVFTPVSADDDDEDEIGI